MKGKIVILGLAFMVLRRIRRATGKTLHRRNCNGSTWTQGGGCDGWSGKDGEARMHPREEIVREALGETLGLVQAQKQQAPEHFHDSRGVQRRERQKRSFG